jgi:outer membrane lipoprotein SlyB
LKVERALEGVTLSAIIGWVIGYLIENPIGPGSGLQLEIIGAIIGALLALTALVLGEALRETK